MEQTTRKIKPPTHWKQILASEVQKGDVICDFKQDIKLGNRLWYVKGIEKEKAITQENENEYIVWELIGISPSNLNAETMYSTKDDSKEAQYLVSQRPSACTIQSAYTILKANEAPQYSGKVTPFTLRLDYVKNRETQQSPLRQMAMQKLPAANVSLLKGPQKNKRETKTPIFVYALANKTKISPSLAGTIMVSQMHMLRGAIHAAMFDAISSTALAIGSEAWEIKELMKMAIEETSPDAIKTPFGGWCAGEFEVVLEAARLFKDTLILFPSYECAKEALALAITLAAPEVAETISIM